MRRFLDDALVTDVNLVTRGRLYKNKEGQYNHFANRLTHGLVLFLSGKIKFYYDGDKESFEAGENTLVYLPQGKAYKTYPYEAGEFILINFSTLEDMPDEAFSSYVANNFKVQGCFINAIKQFNHKKIGSSAELKSLVYKLIALVQIGSVHGYLPRDHYRKLEPAVNYINENFLCEDISVTKLADMCGISRKYFTLLFSQYYETTPKQYLMNLKIDYARKLLISGDKDMTISKIAEISGFGNIYYFSKLFKARVGVTPSDYKKNG